MLITPIGTIMLWERSSHSRIDSLDAFFHIIEGFVARDNRKLIKQRQLLHVITFLVREKIRYNRAARTTSLSTLIRFVSLGLVLCWKPSCAQGR